MILRGHEVNGIDIFDVFGRPKYAVETFNALTEEQKEDLIHSLAYSLEHLESLLYECLSVAEGTDVLNESE